MGSAGRSGFAAAIGQLPDHQLFTSAWLQHSYRLPEGKNISTDPTAEAPARLRAPAFRLGEAAFHSADAACRFLDSAFHLSNGTLHLSDPTIRLETAPFRF